MVSEAFEAEAVGEDVEVEERVVGGFAVLEGHGLDCTRVEPCDEEFEDVDGDVVEPDGLVGRFEERACEGGAEVRRLLREEGGV